MKKAYKIQKFFLVFILFLVFSECNYAQNKTFDFKKLDSYIETKFKEWEVPGMAVAIVKDDKIVFANGYGIREFGKKEKVDKNTLFQIASNSKSFTSAALSILVDEEKIKWDDKVVDYLPYFELYDDYVTSQFTIRDLLSHHSGLATFSGDLLWYGTTYTREEIIKRAKFLEPVCGFRTDFGYSNIMYLAAGQIIEVVTGQKWEDYIQSHFLTPLKMTSTHTSISQFTETDNLAMPHEVKMGEKPIVLEYLSWDNIAPAGSIISSVADMSQWLRLHLNNGVYEKDTILSEEQIWEMRSPQTIIDVDSWEEKYWESKHFAAYCLGWETFDYHGVKILEHGGGADGMISKTVLVPEENFGFVILTNSINYLPTALEYYILDMYFAEKETDWSSFYLNFFKYSASEKIRKEAEEENLRDKTTKPTLDLKEYCGKYTGDMYGDIEVVMENNKLVVNFPKSTIFTGDLTHWENDTFKIVLRNVVNLPSGKVNFIIENNKVTEMKIDIPNPDFDFTEIKLKKVD